ncbi:MAG: DUF1653 domain-containing protein [Lachnospiraceae bacterium]|nr:DUF1653 domain-containing protein [Lachnospiraceae bacterium]
MRHNPKPQEMYRHFKGNLYQIRCLARHSETGEMMVVYQAMYDTFEIYVRPLAMFMDEVDHVKYPNATQRYRFELLQDMYAGEEEFRTERLVASPEAEERSIASTEVAEKKTAEPEAAADGVQTDGQETESEELNIDPLVMDFLEADTYEQRLGILAALHSRVTNEMINTMAVAVDLEIKDGDVEERYEELKNCLLTFEKYECNRLR